MTDDALNDLQQRLRVFAAERDWEQYHTPKNLAMALAAEVGELLDHFQWLTPEQSLSIADDPDALRPVRDEIADVVIYLARLADILGINILEEANKKVARNADRFPPAT